MIPPTFAYGPVILFIKLFHAKANAYLGETRDRISRILHLTVQTGFLTAILAMPIAPLFFETNSPGVYALTYVNARSFSCFLYLTLSLPDVFYLANRKYFSDTLSCDPHLASAT